MDGPLASAEPANDNVSGSIGFNPEMRDAAVELQSQNRRIFDRIFQVKIRATLDRYHHSHAPTATQAYDVPN